MPKENYAHVQHWLECHLEWLKLPCRQPKRERERASQRDNENEGDGRKLYQMSARTYHSLAILWNRNSLSLFFGNFYSIYCMYSFTNTNIRIIGGIGLMYEFNIIFFFFAFWQYQHTATMVQIIFIFAVRVRRIQ